jgi:hypothetical protein
LRPTIEVASQVVAYVIGMAKIYVEGVGQGSDIHRLYYNGRHDSLTLPERMDVEREFVNLMNHFQELINCVDPTRIPDEGIAMRMEWLTADINKLRELQKERQRRPWRSIPEGEPLGPGSTIGGPSRQQPSLESPEGSDEF